MATSSQRPLVQSGLTAHNPTYATGKHSPLAQLCDVLDRLRSLSLGAVQDVARKDLSTSFVASHNQPRAPIQHNEAVEDARLSLIRFESNQVAPAELVRMHNQDIVPLLDSLLPEDEIASVKPAQDRPLTMRMAHLARLKLIGYAIANNFAGMDDSTSRDVTYKFLRGVVSPIIEAHNIDPQLGREISQLALLKPVAETLFRGAIENGDATAVSHVFSWLGVEIDVNNTVCILDGTRLTPVEAAASLGDLRLARLLLQHNADPNKIFQPIHESFLKWNHCRCLMRFGGALYHACKGQDSNLELARLIMQHGGTICSDDVGNAVHRSSHNIITLLVGSAVPQDCKSRIEAGVIHTVVLSMDEKEQRKVLYASHAGRLDLTTRYPDVSSHPLDAEKNPTRIIDIAAQRGQLATVHLLREWQQSFTDHTLIAGVRSREAKLVDYLLAEGAPILCFSYEYRTTPFAEAIRVKDRRLVSLLQKSHSVMQLIPDDHAFCATIAAASEAGDGNVFADMMALQSKLHPNILGYALTRACKSNNTAIARTLLESGASVAREQYTAVMGCTSDDNVRDSCPCPLISAISNRNEQLVELLVDHDIGGAEHWDPYFSTPLRLEGPIAECGIPQILRILINAGFMFDRGELLSAAVEASLPDMVRFLLTDGSLNTSNTSRCWCDTLSGRLPRYSQAIIQRDNNILQLLLEHDATSCVSEDPGAFAAALQFAPDVYQALVNKALSCRHPSGPLRGYSLFQRTWLEAIHLDRQDIMRLMCSSMVRSEVAPDMGFEEPDLLTFAIERREEVLLHFLIECGLNLDLPDVDRDDQSRLQRLGDGSRQPYDTPLLKSVKMKNPQAVMTLLDLGASINLPARYAIKRSPLQQAAEIGSLSMIELLLSRGADIHAPPATRGGGTPAQLAAIRGFIGVVQYLERHGDNIWAPSCTVNGRTALEGAAEHGRYEMVHWLASRNPPDLTQYGKAAAFARDNGHSAVASMLESMYQARIAEMTPVAPRLTQTTPNARRHVCKTCSRGFERATTLRRHERSHKETYPYRCEDCSRGFRRKDTLDRHIETHTGGTHQCHICGSEHSRRDVLLKHMRDEHSDE